MHSPSIKPKSEKIAAQKKDDHSIGAIEKEPFIDAFLKKIPKDIAASFTPAQLLQIKLCFGTRTQARHCIDKRSVFGFWGWRYYVVFLFGRNRRELTYRERQINAAGRWFFLLSGGFTLFGLSAIALYLLKSFLGIDIFPHFSLGLWSWLTS